MDVSETLYSHLRALAGRYLHGRSGHTLQPTELVAEAYLKLGHKGFEGREHFLAVAARTMRGILVDHARHKLADKRGGGAVPVTLSGLAAEGSKDVIDILALDAALEALAALDPRAARVVELRYFGGLTMTEVGAALDVSVATAERDWSKARAWLLMTLRDAE